jgi:hypothetical protein
MTDPVRRKGGDMNAPGEHVLSPQEERSLIYELAETVLVQAAPEELAIFDETAEEYFQDPGRVLQARGGDHPVGFGVDIALITPYVLAVAGPVVSFLVSVVGDSVRDDMKAALGPYIRRLFGRTAGSQRTEPGPSPAISPAQARQIHQLAHDRASALGLSESAAVMLADSVVGGLLVSG